MTKKPLFVALFFLWGMLCFGQSPEIGAIQKRLPAIKDSLAYVNSLNRLAMLLYEKDVDSTFFYARKAIEIADRHQYAKGRMDALNNLGVVYDSKGNLQLALRYYNEANNGYTSLRDTSNIIQTLMNIALVYNELGKDNKALANYQSALNLGKTLARDSIMSLVIYNYLLQYPDNISRQRSVSYITQARAIAEKYKDKRLLIALDQLVADNEIKTGERQKGLALLDQTIHNAINNQLYFACLDMFIDMGEQLVATDPARAVNYLKEGLAIAEKKGGEIYSEKLDRKLYDFYIQRNDNASAFFYSQKLLKLHDEQDKLNNARGLDYIDYALKERELESSRVASKYQSIFLVLTMVILALCIVMIVVLWRNWKNMNRTALLLRQQFEQQEATMGDLDVMNKNYTRLIKVVAHDLRNPISVITTISALIADMELDAEVGEFMQMIQTSANNSLELINELLETDLDQEQKLNKEELDVHDLLQQSVQLLSFRAKDKNQQLIFDSDLRMKIMGDKEKLWRVISNLIVNAIKFSPNGSEIFITEKQTKNDVIIGVKDSGVGIPPAMRDKIFDPFTSAMRKGTGGEQPFGLGLYISKQIIEAHRGKIWFDSNSGLGTEFFVELPAELN